MLLGILGIVCGTWAGLFGAVAGISAAKGINRKLVLNLGKFSLTFFVGMTLAGAFGSATTGALYHPVLQVGITMTLLFAMALWVLNKRYNGPNGKK